MFIVVRRGPPLKGFWFRRRRARRFTTQKFEIEGAPYCLIETACDSIPWEQVRRVAGKTVPFLLEEGVQAPEGVQVFHGKKLAAKLLERELVKQLRAAPPDKLTVVDYDGGQMDKIKQYFRYAAQIRVITRRTEAYTDYAMELLRETGAALLISRDIRASADSQMLYAPKGIKGRFFAPPETRVFTAEPGEISGSRVYWPRGISCVPELEAQLPEGIPLFPFLCALYEVSGFDRLEQIKLDIGLYI